MQREGDDGASDSPAAPGAGEIPRICRPRGLPGLVERLAWKLLPGNTRRFYLVIAVVTALSLTLSGGVAAGASARIQTTVDTTRGTGLGLATDAAAFRTNLATADVGAATALLAGGTGIDAEELGDYDEPLRSANRHLSQASFVGTAADTEDLTLLSEDFVTYTNLIEQSEANARQGYPVATSYLGEARALAHDNLGPRADSLRRTGEQRIARSANLVAGPLGLVAVGTLGFAFLVLVAASVLMAGRSRRVTHPAGLASLLTAFAALAVVAWSLLAQGHQLRLVATTDVSSYIEANNAAAVLSQMRAAELSAVGAYGTGEADYEEFREDAELLVFRLERNGSEALHDAVADYRSAVRNVERFDLHHRNHDSAVASTLTGRSANSYNEAAAVAGQSVIRSATQLDDRFAAAQRASVSPAVPAVLGILAGALAATMALRRARGYR
jgi:hypothetical protein